MAADSDMKVYAAITGDVAGSARCRAPLLREAMDKALARVERYLEAAAALVGRFAVYRGDGFQGIVSAPESALPAALLIRCDLLSGRRPGRPDAGLDARIAIGVGGISHLPDSGDPGQAGGEAMELSGPALDSMRRGRMLAVTTPFAAVNKELDVHCRLLDALAGRWSPEQAEALAMQIEGLDRKEIAARLHVTTQAVGKRLRLAGGRAVTAACRRWGELLVKPGSK